METEEINGLQKQYIRIATPSKEDVDYINNLLKKWTVPKEDLRPNMSFIIPYHGLEELRLK